MNEVEQQVRSLVRRFEARFRLIDNRHTHPAMLGQRCSTVVRVDGRILAIQRHDNGRRDPFNRQHQLVLALV